MFYRIFMAIVRLLFRPYRVAGKRQLFFPKSRGFRLLPGVRSHAWPLGSGVEFRCDLSSDDTGTPCCHLHLSVAQEEYLVYAGPLADLRREATAFRVDLLRCLCRNSMRLARTSGLDRDFLGALSSNGGTPDPEWVKTACKAYRGLAGMEHDYVLEAHKAATDMVIADWNWLLGKLPEKL